MKKRLCAVLIVLAIASFAVVAPHDVKGDGGIKIDVPDVSGAVVNLPWANDSRFLRAQKKYDTQVLMSAFCTVLNNPSPGEEFNVHLAASSLAGTVLEKDEVFSQNGSIGPYNEEKGYKTGQSYVGSDIISTVGGGVCKVATTLYNVSVAGNLEILERFNHFMPVSYVPYGQDATVAYGSKDLKFKNTTGYPVLIWAKGIENRLYVALYGREKAPSIEWNHKVLNKVKAPKIYKKNPNLKKGEENILMEGAEGVSVESQVTITYLDGTTAVKNMGTSQYWPMPYIIEVNE